MYSRYCDCIADCVAVARYRDYVADTLSDELTFENRLDTSTPSLAMTLVARYRDYAAHTSSVYAANTLSDELTFENRLYS